MWSPTIAEVLQFVVIFPFFSVVFSRLCLNAYFQRETSRALYAQIVYYRFCNGKAFQMCVLCEYADLVNIDPGTWFRLCILPSST